MTTDKEKLDAATSLLREWIYEMSGASMQPPDHWTSDSLSHFSAMKRDYERMEHNTLWFLEKDCGIDLENE